MSKSAWWYVAAVVWVVGILSVGSSFAGQPWWLVPAIVGIGLAGALVVGGPMIWFLMKATEDDR